MLASGGGEEDVKRSHSYRVSAVWEKVVEESAARDPTSLSGRPRHRTDGRAMERGLRGLEGILKKEAACGRFWVGAARAPGSPRPGGRAG